MKRMKMIRCLAAGTPRIVSRLCSECERDDRTTRAEVFAPTDIAGKQVSLADFKGKYVVLEWNNPGCPFVQKHYDSGNMQSLQKRFGAENVAWLVDQLDHEGQLGLHGASQARRMVQATQRSSDRGDDGYQGRNRPRVRREGHAAHVCHRSERDAGLRRRYRRQAKR